MTLNVIIRYVIHKYYDAFVSPVEGNVYIDVCSECRYWHSISRALWRRIYPELNTDFECPISKLEFCHKSTVLQLGNADVKFSSFVCFVYHVLLLLT